MSDKPTESELESPITPRGEAEEPPTSLIEMWFRTDARIRELYAHNARRDAGAAVRLERALTLFEELAEQLVHVNSGFSQLDMIVRSSQSTALHTQSLVERLRTSHQTTDGKLEQIRKEIRTEIGSLRQTLRGEIDDAAATGLAAAGKATRVETEVIKLSTIVESMQDKNETTDRHHIDHLEKRASRTDEIIEEAARKALGLEEERRQSERAEKRQRWRLVGRVAGIVLSGSSIVALVVLTLLQRCGK